MYYWTCPRCGANLDAGEKCDCRERRKAPDLVTIKGRKPRADPDKGLARDPESCIIRKK